MAAELIGEPLVAIGPTPAPPLALGARAGMLINEPILGPGGVEPPTFIQRIYDTTAGWCYYTTSSAPDPAPAPTATEPNHTNNLSAATHGIIGGS